MRIKKDDPFNNPSLEFPLNLRRALVAYRRVQEVKGHLQRAEMALEIATNRMRSEDKQKFIRMTQGDAAADRRHQATFKITRASKQAQGETTCQ